MIRITALALMATLVACETIPTAGAGRCSANRVTNFVGALATADIGTVMLRRSGARSIRWIQPGSAVTMDYRLDRLNVRVDGRNFVTAVDCG